MRLSLASHFELLAYNLAITALNRSMFIRTITRLLLSSSHQGKEWLWFMGLFACGVFGFVFGFCLMFFLG